jgi:hypothetical protein
MISTVKFVTGLSSFLPRWAAIATAASAIAILVLRSAFGPFQAPGIHTAVHSPFTAETLFWLAILALLFFTKPQAADRLTESTLFPLRYLFIALCIVAFAFSRNLADPFLSDDYIILNTPSFHWSTFLSALHRAGGDGSYRPLGTVYHQLLKSIAGTDPVKWHFAGLGLHLLNCALVFQIAWKLWKSKPSATAAALAFGVNGTRPEAALWSAGNFDLLACACALGSINLILRNRESVVRLASALILVATGVLFKESAYATPLVAFFLFWPAVQQNRQYCRFLGGGLAICIALLAWRWHLFNGPGGYIDPATGHPAILSFHPLTVVKALAVRIWIILLAPVNWDAPLSWWLPVAIAACLGGLLLLAMRNQPGMRNTQLRLIAATCCAVLPAIHLALIGQSEMGSRVLYLAGAPFALFIGSLITNVNRQTIAASILMIAGSIGILEHDLGAWHAAAMHAQELCRQAAPTAPGEFNGVFLFQNGYRECVADAHNNK